MRTGTDGPALTGHPPESGFGIGSGPVGRHPQLLRLLAQSLVHALQLGHLRVLGGSSKSQEYPWKMRWAVATGGAGTKSVLELAVASFYHAIGLGMVGCGDIVNIAEVTCELHPHL